MKVNGGYMFPGSNSGIDLFALTGWLPEQIFFEEHRKGRRASITSTKRVWQRLVSAHEYGDCLVTVSTESVGETLTEEEAERLGLVPGHAYAVLDVKEVQGVRLLQVKNPWARKRWRGPYSVDDTARWTAAMKRAVGYDLAAAQLEDNGVFWIDWPSICRFFKNVFINWNPALFKYRSVLHGEWPVTQGPPMDTYNLGLNPQYTLTVPYGNASASASAKPPIVWVLLSRHVMELETDEASGDYLTLHVFDNSDGARVWYPSTPMYKGTYTNNPHTLVRFDLPERSSPSQTQRQYTLVLSQYKKTRDVRYTLNVYCSALFELQPTPEPPPHRQRVQGSWGPGNAGGRLGSARYHTNPQYAITLTTAAVLHVQLEAPKEYAINLTVVRSSGERVDSVPVEKEVLTSEAYRPGFCFAASPTPLPAGTYTVIVSTYEGGQQGGFILTAAASTVLQKPALVPAEGEGMWSRVVTGAWSEACGTAVGCCNYKNYNGNPQFSLSLTAPTTSLLLRLSAPATALRPALNVAVFEAASPDTLPPKARPTVDRSVCTSNEGVYTDGVCGCVARATAVPAGEYIVVVSTFMPQDCPFELAVYTQPAPAHFAQII
ncbi:hypothetical protein JKP88DRAFT_197520 [Tribonema minus]|uniref:Calpain catalytic domain-containing protein n=1 Tax=Tribonema minus TaxID=303371 RepID=A0A835Z8N9_9STRA|nr:hypothetical protein JKP88DRAFT_197520 [Tribonema minus]